MHFVIYGAGALGGYYGGSLERGGHEVTYVARGAHLAAMQANGLTVELPSGGFHLEKVRAVGSIAEAGPAEVIFYAIKNYDIEGSLDDLEAFVGPETCLITIQNGVSAPAILAERFGTDVVLPGAVRLPADIKEPGVIRVSADDKIGGITFGPFTGGVSERASSVFAAMEEAGVPSTMSEDIWRVLWEKFIMLSSLAAITAPARLNVGAIRACEASNRLLRQLIDEATAVARATHASVPEDAGDKAFEFLSNVPGVIHASMLDDLMRGKRLELEWLSGEVVRRGKALGIETPGHAFAYALLLPYAQGRPEGSHF